LDPGGMPFARAHFAWPAMFDEAHRFPLRAAWMRARLHDENGIPFRSFEWALDGYGRISGVDITELSNEVKASRRRKPQRRKPR
jgi:hypothetical protein